MILVPDGYSTVEWGNPVNWNHPLNRGLSFWLLGAPNRYGVGGGRWWDLAYRWPGNRATAVNYWKAGRNGGMAATFAGTGGASFIFANKTSLKLSETAATIAFWVKAPHIQPINYSAFIDKGFGDSLLQHVWSVRPAGEEDDGRINVLVRDGVATFPSGSYLNNIWCHLVVTWDGTNVYLYRDGMSLGSQTMPVGFYRLGDSNPLDVGAFHSSSGRITALCQLDDIRLYESRILTSLEVSELYKRSRFDNRDLLNRFVPLRRVVYEEEGASDLVSSDAEQAHASDNIVLTQDHTLLVQDAVHSHAADSLVLTQQHTLVIQDAVHANSTEEPTTNQESDLVLFDSTHSQVLEEVSINQDHNLDVDHSQHSHVADNPETFVVSALVVIDSQHTHTGDLLNLSQDHDLETQETAHIQSADDLSLTGEGDLTVQDPTHELSSDTLSISQNHALVISDNGHAHFSGSLSLGQLHSLVVFDGTHAYVAANINLSQQHTLIVLDSTHPHFADGLIIQDLTVSSVGEIASALLRPAYARTAVKSSIAVARTR